MLELARDPRARAASAATPDVPVLVLSGREDLVTPLEQAREVAATYPRATLLEIPHVGHSVLNDSACARAAAATFIAGATPSPCPEGGPRIPLPPTFPGRCAASGRSPRPRSTACAGT